MRRAPEDHRPRGRRSAHGERRRRYGDRVQWGDLQSSGDPSRTGGEGPPIPLPVRHGNGAAGLSGMGHRVLRAHAGHVRGGVVDGVAQEAGAGARPDGHQAAVLPLGRRRRVLRLGTEGHSGAPGDPAGIGSGSAGLLSGGELRTGAEHADCRHQESAAGTPFGMAARESVAGAVVEAGGAAEGQAAARIGERGTGLAARRERAGAPGIGRTAGGVGVGRIGLFHDPALCGDAKRGAAEDVLGIVRGPQLRRKPVFSRDRTGLRHRPPRVRFEPGCGTAERDRGLRLLFGRTERGRGGIAAVVPVAHDPAACDGGTIGRRSGRVIRRVSDLCRR